MDFLQLAKERYSVRKFSNKKVEQEKINLILEAGKLAPTAVNYQPQRILVIESDDSLNKLKECTKYHFNAPLAMLICYDNTISWKRSYDNKEMGEVDASIVATQMMLEITNLNLGTTWVGHFDPQKIIEAFSLPENIIPVGLFPIGYPDENSVPHQLHEKRFEISETVIYNSFKK
ncbi:MAG: nitroreductase family protein [Psychrilyobacter sp.]|uniref:nitroreductase family protein n=1 Tax=Psychrilyobacter sp. TaxID=2586924 RepID=UPI003C7804F2